MNAKFILTVAMMLSSMILTGCEDEPYDLVGETENAKYYFDKNSIGDSSTHPGFRSGVVINEFVNKETDGAASAVIRLSFKCNTFDYVVELEERHSSPTGGGTVISEKVSNVIESIDPAANTMILHIRELVCQAPPKNTSTPDTATTTVAPSKPKTYQSELSDDYHQGGGSSDYFQPRLTVNDVLVGADTYAGKKISLHCKILWIGSSGSMTCDSTNGTSLDIDKNTIYTQHYRNLLDRCVQRECEYCVTGKVSMVKSKPVLTDTRLIYSYSGSCYPNRDPIDRY